MFRKVDPDPSLVRGEHEVLDLWRETRAFEKLRKKNEGGPRWSFLDGPITANGFMGVHHAWGRTYKDTFCRYFAMTGHDQRWQNGFDCQGLWVEVQVERDLGFTSKKDIERYGVEEFIQRCKERVWKYSAIQTQQSIRLGMWMDWDNSYFTMSDENNYTIWSFLKRCHERGFIYKGLDSMPWCPRCGTGISEQERKEGYEEVEDDAVYVALPLRGRDGESLLVWTTTPWTLAANVAVAVHPDLTYVAVRDERGTYYVAEDRAPAIAKGLETVGRVKGADMLGWTYDGPFDDVPAAREAAEAHRVIAWDEIAAETGSGLVHIAPGCGKEDFDLGKELGLPVVAPIDESGTYVEGFGDLTGESALDVAPRVFAHLKEKGLFFGSERYRHDYPHCWRCHTPLLFRAVDEWYIDMSWRDEIKEVVSQIRWIPGYGEDLELDWLKNMGDWMISKKRYWGLALPIFECEACDWFDVVGGRDELQGRAVEGWDEFVGDPADPHTPHKPWIDAVKIRCAACGGLASRIPDVGNPWLDAGIVPYSTVAYNTDRDYWARWIPADFVVESFPGQFRNWFYSLLAMSTMMENVPPFKTLLGYALVKDETGREMHYSTGNSIEFDEAADRMSADVMRWMYCRHNPTLNLNFGYAAGQQVERRFFGTLWNTYLFFTNYAILDEFDPSAEAIPVEQRPLIDRWILSDLQMLVGTAKTSFEDYATMPVTREAETFVEQLSNWYVRRNRQRFWDPKGSDNRDKLAAYQTLHEVLVTLCKVLAPMIPFITDRIYQNLVRNFDRDAPESVHLCAFPEADGRLIDERLSAQMKLAQELAAAGRALRESSGHRVRQPLPELRVAASGADAEAIGTVSDLILDELNVKRLEIVADLGNLIQVTAKPDFAALGPKFGGSTKDVAEAIRGATAEMAIGWQRGESITLESGGREFVVEPGDVALHVETASGWAASEAGGLAIALDTTLTPELQREGIARDVVRHIQQLRRDSGLNIEDRIEATLQTESPDLTTAIEEWSGYIASEVQADLIDLAGAGSEGKGWTDPARVKLAGGELTIRVKKL